MILFFARGEIESDKFIAHCYIHYRDIMNSHGNDLPKSVNIIRDGNKKPKFDIENVDFSLSHSHGVIMLGISHTQIGVDIEKVRDINFEKFNFIESGSKEEFFEKWTERESYLKMTGDGLSKLKCDIPKDSHFEHFPVFDTYSACVCSEEQSIIAYEIDLNSIE